ncbi:MAG: hypothetical protein DRJ63_03430 [Thermoprotei archaeon]|nr:MAG: hypothetical protein DRJ63_03430 [Thermoprotei archaeon]
MYSRKIIHVFATSMIHYLIPVYNVEGKDFPAVSITGSKCKLMCKHCYARILQRMKPTETPSELVEFGRKIRERGYRGLLVSGGSDEKGRVPFEDYVDAIKELKKIGLKVFIHTGLVDEQRAKLLKKAGVDMVLYDIVSSQEAIRKILNLNCSPKDYWKGLKHLVEHKVPVAPHIVVGLNEGKPSEELKSVNIVASTGCNALVIVVFTPYPGTPLENAQPPPVNYILKVMEYARRKISAPMSLGCMRPRQIREIEYKAVDLGFNGIAFPSQDALNYITSKNIKYEIHYECCASIAYHSKHTKAPQAPKLSPVP